MHSMTQNSFVEGEVLVTTMPGKRSSCFRPSKKEIGTAFRHKNTPGDNYKGPHTRTGKLRSLSCVTSYLTDKLSKLCS
jgi:hypothetical protein